MIMWKVATMVTISGSTVQYAVESDSSIDGYGTGAEIIPRV